MNTTAKTATKRCKSKKGSGVPDETGHEILLVEDNAADEDLKLVSGNVAEEYVVAVMNTYKLSKM